MRQQKQAGKWKTNAEFQQVRSIPIRKDDEGKKSIWH